MIDVEDLVKYFYDEGKIRKYRSEANGNIQITCPKLHYKYNKNTGELEEHYEKRPSLGIMVDEPYLFNCYSCGFRGSIEWLVAEVLQINILEASRWLSQRYDFDGDYKRRIDEKARLRLKAYDELWGKEEQMKEYPESYFKPFRKIHRYTLDRGFSKEIAVKYEIGYDKSQRRIVMPVRNKAGFIVGLYGRTIDNDALVKYLVFNYTDEFKVVGFDRGQVVFRNKTSNRKKSALVVESGLDVPWADQQDITDKVDVVAILGSKMTKRQAEELSEYEEVILALDNDFAGRKGTEIAIRLLKNRTKVTVAEYPNDNKDLGDCTKEEIESMIKDRKSIAQLSVSKLKLWY